MSLGQANTSIYTVLRQRGLAVSGSGNPDGALIPITDGASYIPLEAALRYRLLLARRSFRKVLRTIILAGEGAVKVAKLEQIAGAKTADYLEVLSHLCLITGEADSVRTVRKIDNIGPTLEWYVADLLENEMLASSAWGVKIDDLPTGGGDYDVLAWLPPALTYVEVKSALPSNVSNDEIKHFLQRSEELAPEMAILLVDSDNDISDVVSRICEVMRPVLRLASGIADPNWRQDPPTIRAQSDYSGIFWGWKRIYVTNSEPSILSQLRRCFQHYHRQVKGSSFWGTPPVNFVTGRVGPIR